MEIKTAQKNVVSLFSKLRHPRIGCMLALQEEVGELAKEILEKEVYGTVKDTKTVSGEAADVFISLLELCSAYDIDLDAALLERLEALKPRIKEWEKLEGQLKSRRDQLDQ